MRAVLLAVTLFAACGTRPYWVRPSHFARARADPDAAIPALDSDNEPTYLNAEAIEAVYPPDPRIGLSVAEVGDSRRGYRIAGIITLGVGGLFLASPKEGSGDHTGEVVAGGAMLGTGIVLILLGYLLPGPEADGPSPGFPATVQEP